ncbi:MAG: DUF3467 domain-containing protein [Candidatus Binatia bacterium]
MAEEEKHRKSAPEQMIIQPDPRGVPEVYSNVMMVNHRRGEFILDFLFVQPQPGPQGQPVAGLRSRVVTSPEHLKRIVRALTENLRRYEEKFGAIEESPDLGHLVH